MLCPQQVRHGGATAQPAVDGGASSGGGGGGVLEPSGALIVLVASERAANASLLAASVPGVAQGFGRPQKGLASTPEGQLK